MLGKRGYGPSVDGPADRRTDGPADQLGKGGPTDQLGKSGPTDQLGKSGLKKKIKSKKYRKTRCRIKFHYSIVLLTFYIFLYFYSKLGKSGPEKKYKNMFFLLSEYTFLHIYRKKSKKVEVGSRFCGGIDYAS